ncbi:MAG: hypothetical protein WCI73_14170, partial [Phycisphaerae bacterium]
VQLAAMSASAAVATVAPITANQPVPMNLSAAEVSGPTPLLPLAAPTSKVLAATVLHVAERLPVPLVLAVPPYSLSATNDDLWSHPTVPGRNTQLTWISKSTLTELNGDEGGSDIIARLGRLHGRWHK